MEGPHIESLSYKFIALRERDNFAAAEPWSGRLGDFECRLESGTLHAEPQKHFTSVNSARKALERHLRSRELRAELKDDIRLCFRYASAKLTAGGSATAAAATLEVAAAMGILTVTARDRQSRL